MIIESSTATHDAVAAEAPKPEASTLGSELVAGFLGAAIAMGCVLLPLLHLITGPLGPFIGGFVAGNRANPGLRGRVIIACTIGSAIAGLIGTAATVLVHLAGRSELPTWFPSSGTLAGILVGVWLYGTVVSGIGVTVSASMGRKGEAS